MGRICARALDDLLHGRPRHPLVDIAFPRIVTRRSTDTFAISEGVALLTNSRLPIAEVAARCGFCNASHFSRAVKAAFGYPPGVFRLPTN